MGVPTYSLKHFYATCCMQGIDHGSSFSFVALDACARQEHVLPEMFLS